MANFSTLRIIFLLLTALGLTRVNAWAQCPASASCTPGAATSPFAGSVNAGIYSVKFNTAAAYTSTGYREGYVDNSCTKGTTITQGNPDSLVIRTGTNVASEENVKVYADWNNNGTFETAELVFVSLGKFVHRGVINPPGNALLNQQLRLRIAADLAQASAEPDPCRTPEFSQTEDYFVTVQSNTQPPVANFFTLDTVTCSGLVTFKDISTGSPTSWAWTFGDNGTSTAQNPIHIYATPGRYTIRLIATSANGSDTLVRENYVYFNDTVPVAPSCRPATQQYCCNYGILRVTLRDEHGAAVIDNPTASGSAGYEDFTCRVRGRIIEGRPYSISVETNPDTVQKQNTKVWIDFNNNGIFTDSTELVFSHLAKSNPIDTMTFLAGPGGQHNKPLRMRVLSDGGSGSISACTNPQLGQAEDYTVVLVENTLPPVAKFVRSGGTGCDSMATFLASPENSVSEFIWDFGDGNIDTTALTSITHEYQAYGSYTVTLVVVGPFGRDTLEQRALVNFLPSPKAAVCAVPTAPPAQTIGIRRVQLGDIDQSSDDSQEGYQDFTCQASTALKKSKAYPITITTGLQNPEQVAMWVDWNNDGDFSATEKVFTSNGRTTHTGTLAPMPAAVVMGTALRMRVASIFDQGDEPQPCGDIRFGQAEDYTVVVVENFDPPQAAFGSPRSTCDGSITFADSSRNQIDSWLWKFGDGDTSTQQNPTHVYANPGTYSVTLIVRNQFGIDSVVKQNYLTIYTNLNLAAPSCTPQTLQNCCGFGIQRVQVGTIDNASADGSESYKDFSCSNTSRLVKGSNYTLQVTTNPQNAEDVRAWIDWNSDGLFDASELIGFSPGAMNPVNPLHTISFSIPASGVEGRGLRLRILSDNANSQSTDPCSQPRFGQIEDYAVLLDTNSSAPTPAFGATANTTCNGFISFMDSSSNVPTSYLWDFGDGTFSTLQNPVKKYTAVNTYTVKLKVSNRFGSDSLIRTNYVRVTGIDGVRPAACIPVRTANCCTGGVTRVQFASVDHSSNPANVTDYEDFTCGPRATLMVGSTVPIAVTMNRGFGERVSGWIDWNDDSTFADNELVVFTPTNTRVNPLRDTIVIPDTAVRNKPLRFRLASIVPNQQPFAPDPVACGTYTNGQVEDYSILVNALPPQAHFYALGSGLCSGTIRFKDSTVNGANRWLWSFGDNGTSTEQNPVHTYLNTGTYTVKLVVWNTLGADSLERMDYVTISGFGGPTPPVCSPNSILTTGFTSGMTSVSLRNNRLGSLFTQTSGNSSEGYRDFTCTDSINAAINDQIIVSMQATGSTRNQIVTVHLDANQDGVFATPGEQLMQNNLQVGQILNNFFRVPNTVTVGNKYRIRVVARIFTGQPATTCDIQDGQAEDYSLVLVPTSAARPVHRSLTVYPNPASSSVKIQVPEEVSGTITPEVVDGLGRVVYRHKATVSGSVLELPVDGLAVGYYTLRLTTANTLYTAPLSIAR